MIITEPCKKLIYKETSGIKLPMFIYMPKKAAENQYIILSIHGGGWTTGIKDNSPWDGNMMRFQAMQSAEWGHIGIVISYRSLGVGGADIEDIYEDCSDAVRYIKNMDICKGKKLIVMGDSAGASLAVRLGIDDNDLARPDAVVACNPVLDCIKKFDYVSENPTHRLKASPLYSNINKAAEFFFMHGTEDPVTPIEDTRILNQKLQLLGFKSQMTEIEKETHAFILYEYQNPPEKVDGYMREIKNFIMSIE